MDHTEIIQRIIENNHAKTYLEIGAATGTNFLKIKAPRKIAVDPKNKIPFRRWLQHPSSFIHSHFYEQPSDDFFLQQSNLFKKDLIDVCFIDGMHTFQQSRKDFENCFKYLSKNGVVIFHDCNPINEKAASPSPVKGMWNGDVWKTITLLRTRSDINVFTLDTDYGIGIVMRRAPESTLKLSIKDIENLTYSNLEQNRKEYLNLKREDYLFNYFQR